MRVITDITLTGGAGEYMESATLVEWRAKAGERVEAGVLVAVVETAKAATEIEAPASGVLIGPLAEIGAEIALGTVLGRIADAADADAPASPAPETSPVADQASPPGKAPAPSAGRIVASPLARRLAEQRGIDLSAIDGSGPGGRIKSRDLPAKAAAASDIAAAMPPRAAPPPPGRRDEVPLLVLLHGFGANRLTWTGLVPRLASAARLLAPDLPGHGANASDACELRAIADELVSRIAREGATSVHLVGHSLGGEVASRIAAMNCLPLASLTLIAPAGLGAEIDGAFLSGFLRAREAASLSPWLARLVADPTLLPAGLAGAILAERNDNGTLARQERLAERLFPDGTQALDISADLARLAVPVKLLWGLGDRIIPPVHAANLPATVGLHRFERTGHMPYLEAPDLTARLVLENIRAGVHAL